MVALTDAFFMLSFLGIVGVTMLKLYNVLDLGRVYSYKGMIITTVTSIVLWLINFVMFLTNASNLTFMILNKISNFSIVLSLIFLLAEVILIMGGMIPGERQGYRSNANKQG